MNNRAAIDYIAPDSPAAMQNSAVPDLPADGFLLNPAIRYWPQDYYSACLRQMEVLRRANTYRCRMFAVPDDFQQPIPAYQTIEYQVQMTPGSFIWGFRFNQYDSSYTAQPPNGVVVKVTESCTGLALVSEFYTPSAEAYFDSGATPRGPYPMPLLLPQPKLVLEPGDVNVEMCNLLNEPAYCQYVLLVAEPCLRVDE